MSMPPALSLPDASPRDRTLGFLGCGRVGRTLAMAYSRAGFRVQLAWSRSADTSARMAGEVPGLRVQAHPQEVVDGVDFVWVTVSDDAIGPLASSLQWRPGQWVVHCSGATEVAALRKAREAGGLTGGFHPLQMFANPQVALQGLAGCVVGIEAEGPLLEALEEMAQAIGCHPIRVPAGDRALYHASAYYVGPFLIALLAEAVALWQRFGASAAEALRALLPLLHGTLSAVGDAGLAGGMGGCVVRGDAGTVQKHLDALGAFDPEAQALYRALALRTVPLGIQRRTLSEERAEVIRRLLLGR
ncbi:putative short-subunit dehydrogenase-like oxidoreductase (DUF2520 family) [Caldimonas thermodepolymerans]|jgi:Uncharacterized conserved protein|uniref:Short-subunit dehydrogenase-like oxidoreductase (DUF2520 family) n=2 Tax=Caldimonas thermodepolymerans TaxID=215580 RepID=A0AA46HXP8_9BURK|nr:putative short-subunit dehydrogenase-like oxidoreductase (DUF2520 family) [Caldimonas thermodepolymerans]TCP09893.1 putative short-subunit dehydrogenase-like oxidoreductase (DUF2520 family) [Caldimonas thermodepolymerans]